MNAVVRATAQAVPKAVIYRIVFGAAIVSTVLALGTTFIVRRPMGEIIAYLLWPFLAVLLVWALAAVLRLRVYALPFGRRGR